MDKKNNCPFCGNFIDNNLLDNKTKITHETWYAYSSAYFDRYKVYPVANSKVNGQIANFIKRLGKNEAPHVARWYVLSNNRFYIQKHHSVDCMLVNAEGLRTEWATNNRMTETKAREVDRIDAQSNIWMELLEENK